MFKELTDEMTTLTTLFRSTSEECTYIDIEDTLIMFHLKLLLLHQRKVVMPNICFYFKSIYFVLNVKPHFFLLIIYDKIYATRRILYIKFRYSILNFKPYFFITIHNSTYQGSPVCRGSFYV